MSAWVKVIGAGVKFFAGDLDADEADASRPRGGGRQNLPTPAAVRVHVLPRARERP